MSDARDTTYLIVTGASGALGTAFCPSSGFLGQPAA